MSFNITVYIIYWEEVFDWPGPHCFGQTVWSACPQFAMNGDTDMCHHTQLLTVIWPCVFMFVSMHLTHWAISTTAARRCCFKFNLVTKQDVIPNQYISISHLSTAIINKGDMHVSHWLKPLHFLISIVYFSFSCHHSTMTLSPIYIQMIINIFPTDQYDCTDRKEWMKTELVKHSPWYRKTVLSLNCNTTDFSSVN